MFETITITIHLNFGVVGMVVLALVLFGIFYNQVVAWLDRSWYMEGYLSLIVALGVFITLLGAAVISWQAALLVLVCFTASGLPMIVGSIFRYAKQRAQEQEIVRQGVK